MHYSFLWALEKSSNCSRIPRHASGPVIISLKPSFFKQSRKEDLSDLGSSGLGILFKAFVADRATLKILTKVCIHFKIGIYCVAVFLNLVNLSCYLESPAGAGG